MEAKDLVARGERDEDPDESLRAAFAPSIRVLHQSYESLALSFFRACRGRLRAPAEALADWGCSAKDSDAREAFLRYLVEGDLNVHVAALAATKRDETLLGSLPGSEILSRFSTPQQQVILGMLGFEALAPSDQSEKLFSSPIPLPTNEVEAFLKKVETWWSNDGIRDNLLTRYLHYQYPPNCSLNLSERDRVSWMILLIRAMGFTIGRSQDWQTRGFIEHCDERGWLDTFSMQPPSISSSSDDRRERNNTARMVWANRFVLGGMRPSRRYLSAMFRHSIHCFD